MKTTIKITPDLLKANLDRLVGQYAADEQTEAQAIQAQRPGPYWHARTQQSADALLKFILLFHDRMTFSE